MYHSVMGRIIVADEVIEQWSMSANDPKRISHSALISSHEDLTSFLLLATLRRMTARNGRIDRTPITKTINNNPNIDRTSKKYSPSGLRSGTFGQTIAAMSAFCRRSLPSSIRFQSAVAKGQGHRSKAALHTDV